MSCSLKALSVFLLLFLLRVQSIDLTHARSLSSPLDFEAPEIDGSAVGDICRIFSTPDTTTDTEDTPPPITTKQVVATTTKPAVQTPWSTQETPIRPQPNPAGPIPNSQSDLAALLLTYLLANSRGHGANPLNRFFSQPIGRLPYYGYGVTSDSDEFAATLLKNTNGRKIGWFSSDSSDES